MQKAINPRILVALTALPLLLNGGCATQQGNDQLMGAGAGMVGGAALGCLTGFLAGGNANGCAKGAAIGAAVGAVTGWGAVKVAQYQASQVRSAQEDQQVYGLTKSVNATQIKINKGTSTPKMVRPGESVKLFTDYSVQLPSSMGSTPVAESWTLKKDGKVLAELPPQNNQRTAGGWNADATVPIPTNAELGTYVIEHKVLAGSSYDTDESTFVVSR
ncbi:MAG: hypothetical protein PHH11_10195 [Methylomonas sp.]|nr:hypothetical protein [Methylomonas sp.]